MQKAQLHTCAPTPNSIQFDKVYLLNVTRTMHISVCQFSAIFFFSGICLRNISRSHTFRTAERMLSWIYATHPRCLMFSSFQLNCIFISFSTVLNVILFKQIFWKNNHKQHASACVYYLNDSFFSYMKL